MVTLWSRAAAKISPPLLMMSFSFKLPEVVVTSSEAELQLTPCSAQSLLRLSWLSVPIDQSLALKCKTAHTSARANLPIVLVFLKNMYISVPNPTKKNISFWMHTDWQHFSVLVTKMQWSRSLLFSFWRWGVHFQCCLFPPSDPPSQKKTISHKWCPSRSSVMPSLLRMEKKCVIVNHWEATVQSWREGASVSLYCIWETKEGKYYEAARNGHKYIWGL